MVDSIQRFSTRVGNYANYRPGYPAEIIGLLVSECGLTTDSVIADIGSGPGNLAEIFLNHGNQVFAVEPSPGMREAAERGLGSYPNFISIDGSAEATTLGEGSVDIVAAGQAFHWFDQESARREFVRILRAEGCVVLVWNERRLEATPFLRDYENFLIKFGTDYQRIRHENVQNDLHPFFAPGSFKVAVLENRQAFDLDGLTGRVLSNSYSPEPGNPNYQPMVEELRALFEQHQAGGLVTIEYHAKVYFGHLRLRQDLPD